MSNPVKLRVRKGVTSPGKVEDKKCFSTETGDENSYQQLTQREHAYKRPDMYIGTASQNSRSSRLFNFETKKMFYADILFPPGCERVFLEPLSNVGDNIDRTRKEGRNPGKVTVLMDKNTVVIRNGGDPIPIGVNEQTQLWVPDMIFGNLLTSSNYSDDKARTGCGMNGLGVKLTNIFSTSFKVEIGDSGRKMKYTQEWSDNMTIRGEPEIEKKYKGESFVEITYTLDFARFGYTEYPDEAFFLFARHVMDLSFTNKISVSFNGVEIDFSNIKDYSDSFFEKERNMIIHYEWPPNTEVINKKGGYKMAKDKKVVPLVEMSIIDAPDGMANARNSIVSFVNGMETPDGGVHVDSASECLAKSVIEFVHGFKKTKNGKGKKEIHLTPGDVKHHLSIILNCHLDNPSFSSQSKTMLGSPKPKIILPEKFGQTISKWELIDRLYRVLEFKQFKTLEKSDGKKRKFTGVLKLKPANYAGTKRSRECTLFLVEGDSAKTYADKMIAEVPNGRDFFGVFPMKGKPLNVMNAPPEKIANNKEWEQLKKGLGLREGVDYTDEKNFNTLNYGFVTILADSDDDGKHIIGLILNYFHCRFPSLLERNFLTYLRTPIIRVQKGKMKAKFYTHHEYEEWRKKIGGDIKHWKQNYYKGLGTSSDEEIVEDSKTPRRVLCLYDDQASPAFRLAFHNDYADERKNWLARWKPVFDTETLVDQPISEFIHYEFIQFSITHLRRAIPRLIDGLKESQRKVLWGAFLKWGKNDPMQGLKKNQDKYKVSRFASHIAESTNYHYGEKSLNGTIVGMAQDFVGANNLPYFVKDGQFGSRSKGGKDAADARYIHTHPQWSLPYIYRREDIPLLQLKQDEDQTVEPLVFYPILPMEIINGIYGIGTGHSTMIPCHNPLDVCETIKRRIEGKELTPIKPWFRGFQGELDVIDRVVGKKDKMVLVNSKLKLVSNEEDPNSDENDLEEDLKGVYGEEEVDDDNEERNPEIDQAIAKMEPKTGVKRSLVTKGIFRCEYDPKLISNNGDKKIVKVVISELPIGCWTDSYEKWLESLEEKKKITDLRSLSDEKKGIKIEFFTSKVPTHKDLRLQKSFGMSNMVMLSNNDVPTRYETTTDILEAFYQERLPIYEKRRQYIIKHLSEIIDRLTVKAKFLEAIKKEELKIKDRPLQDIYSDMDQMNFPRDLIKNARIANLAKDDTSQLLKKIENFKNKRNFYIQTTAAELWTREINEFENAYCLYYKCLLPNGSTPSKKILDDDDEDEDI